MSGLLSSLAARFSAEATSPIQPRPVYRFEGDTGKDGFEEIATEATAAAPSNPSAQVMGPTSSMQPPSVLPPPPAVHLTRPSATPETHQTTGAGVPEVLGPAPPPQTPLETSSEAPEASLAAASERLPVEAPEVVSETRLETTQVIETVRWEEPAPPGPQRPAPPGPLSSVDNAPGAPLSASADPVPAAQPEPSAPPAPVIKIGRIEVRSPAPAAPPPAPPRPQIKAPPAARPAAQTPATPARSGLTDYLGWRR